MKKLIGVIMALSLVLVSGIAFADTATVNFTAPSVRTDGVTTQPLDPGDITVFTFYRSPNIGGPFDVVQGAISGTNTSFDIATESAPFYVCFTTTANNPGTTVTQEGACSAPAEIPATVANVFPPGAGTIDSVTITFTIP